MTSNTSFVVLVGVLLVVLFLTMIVFDFNIINLLLLCLVFDFYFKVVI